MTVVKVVIGIVVLAAVVLNFANVVGRYVFLRPIIWAEEVMVFGMIWMVMLGSVIVAWNSAHLRMEGIYDLLPRRARQVITVLSSIVLIAVSAYITSLSFQVIQRLLSTNQKSVAAGVPMVLAFAAIPISFLALIVVTLVRFRENLRAVDRHVVDLETPLV